LLAIRDTLGFAPMTELDATGAVVLALAASSSAREGGDRVGDGRLMSRAGPPRSRIIACA